MDKSRADELASAPGTVRQYPHQHAGRSSALPGAVAFTHPARSSNPPAQASSRASAASTTRSLNAVGLFRSRLRRRCATGRDSCPDPARRSKGRLSPLAVALRLANDGKNGKQSAQHSRRMDRQKLSAHHSLQQAHRARNRRLHHRNRPGSRGDRIRQVRAKRLYRLHRAPGQTTRLCPLGRACAAQ